MALPVTISGATYPANNNYVGPFKSSSGNFYVVAFDTTTRKPAVYKATDPTSSFSEQDSANRPIQTGESINLSRNHMNAMQDGNILRLIMTSKPAANQYDYYYDDFNMGTDLWGTKDVLVLGTTSMAGGEEASGIIKRSDGSLIVLIQNTPENVHGTSYSRVYYVKSTDSGITWSAATAVGATGVAREIIGGRNVLGASDRCHFFYSDDTTAKHRSLSSADALATEETPTGANAVTASEHNFIYGISYVSGANTVIKTAYRASGSDKLDSIEFNSAATGAAVGTAAFIDNTIFDDGTTDPASVHGCLAVNGMTTWCLYSNQAGQDVFSDSETDGGAWGTDVNQFTAVINAISCNVYTRAGNTVLAYVCDDGGTVKYNEIVLQAAVGGGGPAGGGITPNRTLLGVGLFVAANPVMRRRGFLAGVGVAALRRLIRRPFMTRFLRAVGFILLLAWASWAWGQGTPAPGAFRIQNNQGSFADVSHAGNQMVSPTDESCLTCRARVDHYNVLTIQPHISGAMRAWQVSQCGSTATIAVATNANRRDIYLRNGATQTGVAASQGEIWIGMGATGHVALTAANGFVLHSNSGVASSSTDILYIPNYNGPISCIGDSGGSALQVLEILR